MTVPGASSENRETNDDRKDVPTPFFETAEPREKQEGAEAETLCGYRTAVGLLIGPKAVAVGNLSGAGGIPAVYSTAGTGRTQILSQHLTAEYAITAYVQI